MDSWQISETYKVFYHITMIAGGADFGNAEEGDKLLLRHEVGEEARTRQRCCTSIYGLICPLVSHTCDLNG